MLRDGLSDQIVGRTAVREEEVPNFGIESVNPDGRPKVRIRIAVSLVGDQVTVRDIVPAEITQQFVRQIVRRLQIVGEIGVNPRAIGDCARGPCRSEKWRIRRRPATAHTSWRGRLHRLRHES